jgi:superfamily II DNA or RNA helicase
MYADFQDYSSANNWDVEGNCHKLCQGSDKNSDKKVVISTWQSLYNLPEQYFSQFQAVIVDEAHQAKSQSIKTILENLKDCPYRYGLTGTLDGMATNQRVIEGLTGRHKKFISTSELMTKNLLSTLQIDCILLGYSDHYKKACKELKYQEEIDFLVSLDARNNFIADLAIRTKGNTLVLFQYIEKHGDLLNQILDQKIKGTGKSLYYIHGETEVEVRENVRKLIDINTDSIILASYGIFSTGINAKNLNNIIFSSPSKSKIRVLQSIGRQLRISETKNTAKLYDIADDLSWRSRKNYTLKHFFERVKIYNEEKFQYDLYPIKLKDQINDR